MTGIRVNDKSFDGVQFRRLSDEQNEKIHNASLEILERTGAILHEQKAIDLLKKAGAFVADGNRVRIPSALVEKAFTTVPKRVVLCDRYGRRVMQVEGHRCFYGPGSDLMNIIDHRTNERRKPVLADVRDAMVLCDALPDIGSVCSGGRYDNLAELYTAQQLPGIGASLGLDRLLSAMEELGMIEKVATLAPVLLTYFDKTRLHDYLRLATAIRAAGIGVEVFPEPKKLGQQLKYADRRGFRVALIAGDNEFTAGTCQVKDLESGDRRDVPLETDAASVVAAIKEILE